MRPGARIPPGSAAGRRAGPVKAQHTVDVAVIGGGQAGLAAGYHLKRLGVDFVILDASPLAGGSWSHRWDSLRLLSPAPQSALPGLPMPGPAGDAHPRARDVVDYLGAYEARHRLPVVRPVRVLRVLRSKQGLRLETSTGEWQARAAISATGTWGRPVVPHVLGRVQFRGRELHTVDYTGPRDFTGQRILVVGGGNSGAQITADLAEHAEVTWATSRPPRFLPDEADGAGLFGAAAAGQPTGEALAAVGDGEGRRGIVAVPAVRAARAAGALTARPLFERLLVGGVRWPDGRTQGFDAVIWCTGFQPELTHLASKEVRVAGWRAALSGTQLQADPRLHFLGYGDWTGTLSATLCGVGRSAEQAATAVAGLLT